MFTNLPFSHHIGRRSLVTMATYVTTDAIFLIALPPPQLGAVSLSFIKNLKGMRPP